MYEYFFLCFCIAVCVVVGQETATVKVADLQTVNFSSDGKGTTFFSDAARNAANEMLRARDNLQCSVTRYCEEIFEYHSKATDATKLTTVINSCKASVPSEYSESMDENIDSALIEIHKLDDSLRQSNSLCSSLSTSVNQGCKDFKTETEGKLSTIASKDNLDKLNNESQSAFDKTLTYLNNCVGNNL